MNFFRKINEINQEYLSLDTFLKSEYNKQVFLSTLISIETYSSGIQMQIVKIANNGNINDYIFSINKNIYYKDEFNYQSYAKIKSESIDNSQIKLIFNHFSKLPSNSIPINTVLNVTFILKQNPSLSIKNSLILNDYASCTYETSYGKIYITSKKTSIKQRLSYAQELKISTPLILFDGIIDNKSGFENGIRNKNLNKVYNEYKPSFNWTTNDTILFNLKKIFSDIKTSDGHNNGVIVRFVIYDISFRWCEPQLDILSVTKLRQKYVEDNLENENNYWSNVKSKAYEILPSIKKTVDINKMLGDLSDILKRLQINFGHSKKSLNQIKDDIQKIAKILLIKQIQGNNGCLIVGKFRILTNSHVKLINSALKQYSKVYVCIVNKDSEALALSKQMLENVFDTKINIIESLNYGLKYIINKIPFNINIVYTGSDKIKDYQKQLSNIIGTTAREMYKSSNAISASDIINNLNSEIYFQNNTPKKIHFLYDKIKQFYLSRSN